MFKFFTPQNQSLLRQLVITDFKLRYQGSVLGYLWSLLKPMMMFGVLFVVFTYIIPMGKDVPHFASFLLLGIVVWTFFVEATSLGLGSIVGRADLLKKVKISRFAIVVASILSAGVNFVFNLAVVAVFMIFGGADVNWPAVPALLLLFVELLALSVGLAFILSALFVKYRDISSIWEIILQVMFYATPIIYNLTFVTSDKLASIISLSPLAQIIQDAREILITPATRTTHEVLPAPLSFLLPMIIVGVVAIGGWFFFKARAKYFVEDL